MLEPEGLFFFALCFLASAGAITAAVILFIIGRVKKVKAPTVIAWGLLFVALVPSLYVGSWIYYWMSHP